MPNRPTPTDLRAHVAQCQQPIQTYNRLTNQQANQIRQQIAEGKTYQGRAQRVNLQLNPTA